MAVVRLQPEGGGGCGRLGFNLSPLGQHPAPRPAAKTLHTGDGGGGRQGQHASFVAHQGLRVAGFTTKPARSPTTALLSARPFPTHGLCAHPTLSTATATTGHWKESNAEQARLLLAGYILGFFFRCRWLFSQNTLQQTKTGIAVCRYIAGTGSAFSTSPGGQPWSFLSPVGIHHLLLFFFFPLFTFFLCVFFPLSPLYNTSPSFLQRKGHWLWASRLQKSSRTRGLVSSSRLAADLVEIVFQLLFLLQK